MIRNVIIVAGLILVGLGAWAVLSSLSTRSPVPPTQPAGSITQELSPAQAQLPADGVEVPLADDPTPPEFAAETPPGRAAAEFSTDFSRHTISYADVLSGGPPKDGIPAIDQPQLVDIADADAWLSPLEPVVLVQVGDEARAYPLQILTWHEIVNDELGGVPVTVTFCPLCNTAIAFERSFDGQILDFGTTGRLRFSNLIMYDRQTETWWQQASGEGIAGKYAGQQLTFFPAAIISWQDFMAAHPDASVLSRETGYPRDYGRNPYAGYDDIRNSPFLYKGPDNSDRLPPMERVLTIELGDEAAAYPYSVLTQSPVANDTVAGQDIVVFWEPGTASALDASAIAQGRDIGTANSFSRQLNGRTLTFLFEDGQLVDQETGSVWDVLGRAISGELQGSQLTPVVGVNHFWFSWAAFMPETRIYSPDA